MTISAEAAKHALALAVASPLTGRLKPRHGRSDFGGEDSHLLKVRRIGRDSNTLLVVESNLDVPWTKPEDIPYDESQPVPSFGGIHQGGCCAGLCDGSTGSGYHRAFFSALSRKTLVVPAASMV